VKMFQRSHFLCEILKKKKQEPKTASYLRFSDVAEFRIFRVWCPCLDVVYVVSQILVSNEV
jgi:hypothetical protein